MARRHQQPALHLLTLAALAMAVGTAAQHASGTHAGLILDHLGMEAANVAMLLMGLRRWGRWPWPWLLVGGGALWVGLGGLTVAAEPARRLVFAAGMVPAAALEVALWRREGRRTGYRWLGVGWAVFLTALGAWWVDQQPFGCDPDSPWQLHPLWHAGSAAAVVAWARYFTQFHALRRPGPPPPG